MFEQAIELEGQSVKLIPLQKEHREGIIEAASDGELWKLWYTGVPSQDTVDSYIETALTQAQKQQSYPFAVIDKSNGHIIGSTRFCNADHTNRRLEIGYTWYAKRYQRTTTNTQCKLALLTYAFEQFQAIAVEFRTNFFNHRSRQAIARLGAKQDGILRNHIKMPDGLNRDTVVFSITDYEWLNVKKHLNFKLSEHQ